jgi:iron complex outermembrane receptor protein
MFKTTTITGAILALAATSALAQEAQKLERIEITGSSIRRVDAETALPVTVLSRAEIERTGVTTAQDLVQLIPAMFGGTVVASNVGATGVASTAALRGLDAKYTLVLLNGRRVANYAFGNSPVDLNSIPLSAVERVEILRDGASAIYGADAVAGVVNFILRKDYKGLEANFSVSLPQGAGGESKSLTLTGGFGDLAADRFNVLISANKELDEVLKASQRSFATTADRPDLGINKASPRNGIPNLNFVDTMGNGYGSAGNSVAPLVNPFRYNGCNNPAFALVVRDASTCGTDYVKYIDLIPKQSHQNIFARAVFQATPDHQIFAEAMHVKDNTVATYSPAPYTLTMSYPATGRFYPKSITLPAGMPVKAGFVYPDGTVQAADGTLANDVVVTPTGPLKGTWRTVAGGGRTDITDTTTDRFLLGAKGTVADWDYEGAIVTSKNTGTISFGPGKFSYAALTPLIAKGDINVFGPQDAVSQAALNSALLTGPEQTAVSKSTEFDFHVSKEVVELPAGPVGLAMGVSFRKEELNQISYPVLASGDEVGGNGPVPGVTGDRKVYGAFTEVNVPVVKGLEIQGAARYDNYKNGFGTSFHSLSPKLSLRYQPTKELLARASVGRGYRAPTLYENLRPFTAGNNTAANWSDPVRCPNGKPIDNTVDTSTECNVQQPTALEGNKTLRPEKSNQYSVGLVFSPMAELTTSIDFWSVNIKDSIAAQSEIQVFQNPTQYANAFYRYNPAFFPNGYDNTSQAQNPVGAIVQGQDTRYPLAYVYLPYANTSRFFASGIDLSAQFKQKMLGGTVGANFDGTYYTRHGYQYFGSPSVSDIGDYKDFGPTPRWRHAITVSYARGAWNASLTNNYTAGYHDYVNPADVGGTNYPLVRGVAAYSLWDGQVGFSPVKNVDLTMGIKNLLNTNPPSSRTEVNFQTGYDAQWTNPLGRTFFARVHYKFM